MSVRSALVVAAVLALSGCGAVETAHRDVPTFNLEKLTYRGVLSDRFQRDVQTVIHFGFNQDTLDAGAQQAVAAQAAWIRKHPNVRFAVTGHTDRVGSSAYNMDLGMRRATRVVNALIALGVSEKSLIARVSDGEEVNIVDTDNRERANRRTVTEVVGLIHPAATPQTEHDGGQSASTPLATRVVTDVLPPSNDPQAGNAPQGGDQQASGDPQAGSDPQGGNQQGGSDPQAGGGSQDDNTQGDGSQGDNSQGNGSQGDTSQGGQGASSGGTPQGSQPGNPGNDKAVGGAGETPNGKGGWGSGSHGRGD